MSAKICTQCGVSFGRPKSSSSTNWEKAKYCSAGCAAKGRRKDAMLTLPGRLSAKVIIGKTPDECWGWSGTTNLDGYGGIRARDGKKMLAHRASWIVHRGPIPDGLDVLHHCDNPPCTKPDHLFLGTQVDNAADMVAKGRESRPSARLLPEQVVAIRARIFQGETQASLAREFGVVGQTINEIATRRNWRHL